MIVILQSIHGEIEVEALLVRDLAMAHMNHFNLPANEFRFISGDKWIEPNLDLMHQHFKDGQKIPVIEITTLEWNPEAVS